ncbi:uncharacterized protein LOC129922961 [Biomphalaria glabrata]|uniref:Uncharacterized protein LOC129922961 n=1 Tax=Biomphalaria glabrata TaxID=6526 RepID=A0A9W2YX51_BIOGL|nr:uncharacterized protein LOC129922961 [Biomphalaria glabrata]
MDINLGFEDVEEAEIVKHLSITAYINDNPSPYIVSFPREKFEEDYLKAVDLKCLIISELKEYLSNEEPASFCLSGIKIGADGVEEISFEDNEACSTFMIEYTFTEGFRIRESNH